MSEMDDNARESENDIPPGHSADDRPQHFGAKRARRSTKEIERYRHTRTSAAWAGIVVAVLFGVALIDFIAQNTNDVRIEFFSVSGRLPIAVALLAAALAGAVVVLAVGVGRVAQLRFNMRRQRLGAKTQNGAEVARDAVDAPNDSEGTPDHD